MTPRQSAPLIAVIFACQCSFSLWGQTAAVDLLADKDVRPGLVVHLDCGDGTLTAELSAQPAAKVVQALSRSRESVEKARQLISEKGLYGRVSAEVLVGVRLPYPDNTVNVLVVQDLAGLEKSGVTLTELFRVVTPYGVLWIEGATEKSVAEKLQPVFTKGMAVTTRGQWVKITKPYPPDMDEWPQSLHDAAGTQMSQDAQVGPIGGVRWINGYDWGDWLASGFRKTVTGGGRHFQFHASEPFVFLPVSQRVGMQVHRTWPQLVARDAFNGVELWRRIMGDPNFPGYGLVFGDGLLYVIGLRERPNDKLRAVDPATGETVRVLQDIKLFADEKRPRPDLSMLRYADGVLLVPTREGGCTAWDLKTQKLLWVQNAAPLVNWMGMAGMGNAHDADEAALVVGQNAWVISEDAQKLLCRDLHTGAVRWESALKSTAERLYFAAAGMVFTREKAPRVMDAKNPHPPAQGEIHTLRAWQGDTGKFLWQFCYQGEAIGQGTGCDEVGVYGNEVWALTYRPGPTFVGLDTATGNEKSAITADKKFQLSGHCFPSNLTRDWIISWGTSFFNPLTSQMYHNPRSMRPICGTGAVPANGLMYQCQNCCRCERVIRGGVVAYSSEAPPTPLADAQRLEKGAAFERTISVTAADSDWPMYRHDAARTGGITANMVATPKMLWTATLDGRPTQPVSADGKVFCAVPDQHLVCGLDGKTGKLLWKYRTGARVDSSPTWRDGRVFFGGCDGWVYCLAADDGQLVWRFMAAPEERRIMVLGQLESPWPAHGSLIVDQSAVYVEAGRQTQLDGGLRFYALEPATGKKLWSSDLANLKGGETTSDLMSSDGKQLLIVNDQEESGRHSYTQVDPRTGDVKRLCWNSKDNPALQGPSDMIWTSMMGFLCQRVYGNIIGVGSLGRRHWNYHNTLGDLLSVDGPRAWGFLHFPKDTSVKERQIGADTVVPGNWVFGIGGATPWKQQLEPNSVQMKLSDERPEIILARICMKALIRTGDKLFVASQPDEKPDTGTMTAFEADTGKILGEIPTPGAPCFDGLSFAGGRLYLSCENAKLACFGE